MIAASSILSRDGLALESAVETVDDPRATVVVCHPHPKMGGTMNAPLLLALRDEMVGRRWNVVRFNFRGIGTSQGDSSTGTGEVQDALGAVDHARKLGVPVALVGWSFGASVALRAAATIDELVGCVAIAPAIDQKPGITEGVPQDVTPKCPVLIVIGANDEQVAPASARRWATTHGATFGEMTGANHFFWAKYDDLAETVGAFLEEVL